MQLESILKQDARLQQGKQPQTPVIGQPAAEGRLLQRQTQQVQPSRLIE